MFSARIVDAGRAGDKGRQGETRGRVTVAWHLRLQIKE